MFVREVNGWKVYGKQGFYPLYTQNKYRRLVGWIKKNGATIYYCQYLESADLRHPTIASAQKEIPFKIFEQLDNFK